MARKLSTLHNITPLEIVASVYGEAIPDEIDHDAANQDILSERIIEAIAAQLPDELMTIQVSDNQGGVWQLLFPEDDLIPAPEGIWIARTELPVYARDAAWVKDSVEAARRIDLDSLVRDVIRESAEQ